MEERIIIEYAGRQLTISTGAMAKQADGSVIVQYGDTVVLVTVVVDKRPSVKDFLPLTVNYQEMTYAAGKFPGGFFKREGRPSTKEILTSRLIDRPLRPLFPKGFTNEVQVIATVLSADQENDPAILGMLGASCALTISEIPFDGPLAGIKVGRKDGSFLINPNPADLEKSDLNIVITGNREAIIMVEGEANFVSGEELIEAIHFGHQNLLPLIEIQEQLREKVGRKKWDIVVDNKLDSLVQELKGKTEANLLSAFSVAGKLERAKKQNEVLDGLIKAYPDVEESLMKAAFEDLTRDVLRKQLFSTARRIDGRTSDEIRPLSCNVSILPRTHGSALFTRGETQSLAVTTFGTSEDEAESRITHGGRDL